MTVSLIVCLVCAIVISVVSLLENFEFKSDLSCALFAVPLVALVVVSILQLIAWFVTYTPLLPN